MASSRQIIATDIAALLPNISFSGVWDGNAKCFIQGNISGTLTATGIVALNKFNVNADNTDATTSNGISNIYVGLTVNGSNAKGHRTSTTSVISVSGTTGNTSPGWYYTASASIAFASVNDNGATGNGRGNLFGGNDSASLLSGATFWNSVVGREVDIEVRTGASVAYKIGFQVVQLSTDTQSGSAANYGYSLANQPSGAQPGWDFGFTIGAKNGVWPIKSTGTLIGTDATALGGSSYAAAYGVDLSAVTFSGAPFVAPLMTPASSSATGKQGSILWDAGFIYICTAVNTWKRVALSTF